MNITELYITWHKLKVTDLNNESPIFFAHINENSTKTVRNKLFYVSACLYALPIYIMIYAYNKKGIGPEIKWRIKTSFSL
jgi:hypothetical protein